MIDTDQLPDIADLLDALPPALRGERERRIIFRALDTVTGASDSERINAWENARYLQVPVNGRYVPLGKLMAPPFDGDPFTSELPTVGAIIDGLNYAIGASA